MNQFGVRLVQLRKQQGWSQRKLAELCGLTHTAINSIEKDKVSPSISSLQKILTVFGLSLADFFTQDDDHDQSIKILPDQFVEIGGQKVSLRLLSKSSNKMLGMMLEEYAPQASTGMNVCHEGFEVGYILEGKIDIHTNGKVYTITAGEGYLMDTSQPHGFSNTGLAVCKIISASTPLSL